MEKLTIEQVKHVADLAKLEINSDELSKYQEQLQSILNEIYKVDDIIVKEDILFSPSTNSNCYKNDQVEDMITADEALKNAPHRQGNFIVVPRVLND